MRKNEKKSIFSKTPQCSILSFWILNLHIIICQFQEKSTVIFFFLSQSMFLPLVSCIKVALLLFFCACKVIPLSGLLCGAKNFVSSHARLWQGVTHSVGKLWPLALSKSSYFTSLLNLELVSC